MVRIGVTAERDLLNYIIIGYGILFLYFRFTEACRLMRASRKILKHRHRKQRRQRRRRQRRRSRRRRRQKKLRKRSNALRNCGRRVLCLWVRRSRRVPISRWWKRIAGTSFDSIINASLNGSKIMCGICKPLEWIPFTIKRYDEIFNILLHNLGCGGAQAKVAAQS